MRKIFAAVLTAAALTLPVVVAAGPSSATQTETVAGPWGCCR